MTGKIDQVAVRQEARARAGAARSTDTMDEWSQMQELYHLRTKLMYIEISGCIEPEAQLLAPQPPSSVDGSRFWAVLIGIDAYSWSPLQGCLSDARQMAKYLTQDLGVPEDHIQHLLSTSPQPHSSPKNNGAGSTDDFAESYAGVESRGMDASLMPTRANIIDTLLDLSTNPKIQHGDNIIIYFSGRGSSYDLSDIYEIDDIFAHPCIEALCPVDRTASGTDISIPDISDREINIILTEISRTKGNHITFILDCCCSSGDSRGPSNAVHTIRYATPLPPTSLRDMLEAAHTRLRDLPKYHPVFGTDWKPDMTSHVILAACEETHYAEEVEGADNRWNGIFTQALIKALKSCGLKEESTYIDVIRASKMPQNTMQRPVIAGNSGARLWYQPETNKIVSPRSGILLSLLSNVRLYGRIWE